MKSFFCVIGLGGKAEAKKMFCIPLEKQVPTTFLSFEI
jgi:hypothetical protein